MLTNQELMEMYQSTIDVLSTVGIYFTTEKALTTFKNHGFRVDGQRVYITQRQLEENLALMPDAHYEPTPEKSILAVSPFLNAPNIYDESLGKYRRTLIQDVVKTHMLTETSDFYAYANPGLIDPTDLDMEDNYISQIALMLKYTKKPINLGIRATATNVKDKNVYRSAREGIHLLQKFYNTWDKPVLYQGFCPMSPLGYDEECLANLDVLIEEKQGIILFPCSLTYMTGPETIKGIVVHDFALSLAGIVYVQLLSPGLEVSLSEFTTMTDIHSLQPSYGTPEYAHIQVMYYELCKLLRINGSICGSTGDSLKIGYQAGCESVLSTLLPFMLTELNEIWCYPGSMGAFSGADFRKMILDEESMRYMSRGLNKKYVLDKELIDKLEESKVENSFLQIGNMADYKENHYITNIFSKKGISQDAGDTGDVVFESIRNEIEKRLKSYQRPELTKEQIALLKPYLPKEEWDF